MAFITENIGTILVTLILAVIVVLITHKLIQDRKKENPPVDATVPTVPWADNVIKNKREI